MRQYLRPAALALHHLHQRAYTYWKINQTGVRFRSRLSLPERIFYLRLRPALIGQELVVYDIGASIGIVTGCLAKVPSVCVIHAFEPIPSVFSKLVERMRPHPQVVCHNVALGDEDNNKMIMHVNRLSDSSSLLRMMQLHKDEIPGTGDTHPQEVRVVRLDDFVQEQGLPQPDVIKIDVQGYEDRVLRGGARTVSGAKHCVLEMSLHPLYEGAPLFDDIYHLMRGMGFRLTGLAGTLFGKSGRRLQLDGIFQNEWIDTDALSNPQ